MEGRSAVERRSLGRGIDGGRARRRAPSRLLPLCAALALAPFPALSRSPESAGASCSARFPRVECLARPAPGSATRQVLRLQPSQPASRAKTVVTGGEDAEPGGDDARPLSREQVFGSEGEADDKAAEQGAPSSRE